MREIYSAVFRPAAETNTQTPCRDQAALLTRVRPSGKFSLSRGRRPVVVASCSRAIRGSPMKRREFMTLVGGAAVAWPLAARAQQRTRRIGVLMGLAEDDPESRSRLAALARALQDLGWIEGHNIGTDYRWAAGDIERTHILATELVRSAPDAIVVNTPTGVHR